MEITNVIKKIATEGQKIQTCPAKVVRINVEGDTSLHEDADAYTVDVIRSDGAKINNVRLKASIQEKEQGLICVPKEGSWVLVSIIETTETRAFISQYSEIEKIFLRIKNDDDQYFELQTNGDSTELRYKKPEGDGSSEVSSSPPTYKNIASLGFGADKKLDAKFWDDAGEKVVQQTTIAHDKVTINFNEGEGYQTSIENEKVSFIHEDKGLGFEMGDKFEMKVGELNLKEQFNSLITEIQKIVVAQGVSPDVGALADINKNINDIMK